jgi:hypothetical protein
VEFKLKTAGVDAVLFGAGGADVKGIRLSEFEGPK